MRPTNPKPELTAEFESALRASVKDFRSQLDALLADELKSSIILIDRRNNIMNYLSFVMPHVTNKLMLPLGLYKKIHDEQDTLGAFRDWRFDGADSSGEYRISPPELLVHLRDTCFHLDQFLETPSATGFNRLIKQTYDRLAAKYTETLQKAGLAGADLKEASDNLREVFQERFAFIYNKSLTSFQIGNMIESFLSLFVSYLASNPFYKIEGLFEDQMMSLAEFKNLFYEHRTSPGSGELGQLPVTLRYFFRIDNDNSGI